MENREGPVLVRVGPRRGWHELIPADEAECRQDTLIGDPFPDERSDETVLSPVSF